MTADPITIGPAVAVDEARRLMIDQDVQRLIVADHAGSLVGVLSTSDVKAAWPSPYSMLDKVEVESMMSRIRVEELMSRDVVSIEPTASVAEAASLLFERRIGALPVVSAGQIVGILSGSDLLQGFVRLLTEHRPSTVQES